MSDFNVSEQNEKNEETIETVQPNESSSLFTDEAVEAPPSKPKRSFVKEAVEYAEIFVFAMGFVLLLLSFAFRICTVEGPSMENTLIEGDRLLITDIAYTPKRGDVIVFHQTSENLYELNEPIVKRVIATAGERVDITYSKETMVVKVTDVHGQTYLLNESAYMNYSTYKQLYLPASYTVPEGSVFVMGDNRNESLDSRSSAIGMVDERSILGKVLFKLPF